MTVENWITVGIALFGILVLVWFFFSKAGRIIRKETKLHYWQK